MSEFEIIKRFFAAQAEQRDDVNIGIGDDTAIVKPPKDCELAITTDTLIAGVHFPETTLPYDIGYKSLAVNLSDLAAVGATPAWVTLALTLPGVYTQYMTDDERACNAAENSNANSDPTHSSWIFGKAQTKESRELHRST